MSDLISRQAAIDAVLELDASHRVSWKDAVIDTIDALPPAQPEIIRCKDCEEWEPSMVVHGRGVCAEWSDENRRIRLTEGNDYCSYGCRVTQKERKL